MINVRNKIPGVEYLDEKLDQQGDIKFNKIKEIPEGCKKQASPIIKLGTASGHAHVVSEGILYLDEKNHMFLAATKDTKIKHDQHPEIDIRPGYYVITSLKEYDHFAEEAREMVD